MTGFAPLDYEPGKWSAQQIAAYKMTVRLAVYQVDGQWQANVSAIGFVSMVNGQLMTNASASLMVDGKQVAQQTLRPVGENLYPGGNQYSYVGETTFSLPSTGSVSINFSGAWAIKFEAGNYVPTRGPLGTLGAVEANTTLNLSK